MNNSLFFNDAPIKKPIDDNFGIDSFAQAMSQSLINIKSPIGVTIAINGQWGLGKTSAINLIRYHLQKKVDENKFEIIDFKCWWFRGEEALTLAFLQQLNTSLQKNLSEKTKDLIPRLGKILLQAGPVVGPAMNLATGGFWSTFTTGAMDFTQKFFSEGENIEKIFSRLSTALEEQNKRFLIIIDDIDRLTPNEALLIFQLVKSVGRLPNVMYLLAFDRELAEKAVKEKYPSEGPHFLEKIIQASFEIPIPARDELNKSILNQIESICGSINDTDQLKRFMNIFYDTISPYLNTPRDLTRLSNALSVSWPPVANEVNISDFVALETMRLFEPKLYNKIRINKETVCGLTYEYKRLEEHHQVIESYLQHVPKKNREHAKYTLMRLFPRFENIGYSDSFIDKWEAQRLVCSKKHFDSYFRMCIGDDILPSSKVNEFIENAGDQNYVKETFLNALKTIRKNGKSTVPLLLDEININSHKIEKSKHSNLISTIFSIADDIFRQDDRDNDGLSLGDNHLRIHWLIRKLTFDQYELEEKSSIFLKASKNAQVGWLVDFTSSSIDDYYPKNGEQQEKPEKCLISQKDVSLLKTITLNKIKAITKSDKLINHPNLLNILLYWKEFYPDEETSIKEWTNNQLESNESVSILARAFTSERWSQNLGFDGLGDRVAKKIYKVSLKRLDNLIDVKKFLNRLEEIEKNDKLDKKIKKNVQIFLDAYRDNKN